MVFRAKTGGHVPRPKITNTKKSTKKPEKPKVRYVAPCLVEKSRQAAVRSGLLPHEWLLAVSRGQPVKQMRLKITYHKTGPKKGEEKEREWVEELVYADFPTRIDAAKAAAPYYTPKLATKIVGGSSDVGMNNAVIDALRDFAERLPV